MSHDQGSFAGNAVAMQHISQASLLELSLVTPLAMPPCPVHLDCSSAGYDQWPDQGAEVSRSSGELALRTIANIELTGKRLSTCSTTATIIT